MVGQGRPESSISVYCLAILGWIVRGLVIAPLVLACMPAAAEENVRLRIAWGGGAERTWQGSVAISDGRLADPQPLGIDADEPGSMWLDETDPSRLVIRQRSPRSYDCVDLSIDAPLTARLLVQLSADNDAPVSTEVLLSTLVGEVHSHSLDGQGNRIVVQRTPGDNLRVRFDRDSLVFGTGEVFKFTVEPHLLPVAAGGRLRLKAQLNPARGQREVWSSQQTITAGDAAPIPIEVPLPDVEGPYDIVLTLSAHPAWAMRQPLLRHKTIVDRKIQVLVMQPTRPVAAGRREAELSPVVTIEPGGSRAWEVSAVKLPALSRFQRGGSSNSSSSSAGTFGNGSMTLWQYAAGEFARLAPNAAKEEVSWEAHALPITQPGRPHVIEIEYPSDVPQTLGISLIEPDASGAAMPFGVDSGIDVAEEVVGGAPRVLRHRMVVWPRTSSPVLLLVNRRSQAPAVYGKIRVWSGWDHLPPSLAASAPGQRLLAAYYDRPLFPENFSASRALDEQSGHCLDDWGTFHEGSLRMVEYLRHVGFNAMVVSALAEGSTLYPSRLLEPTPRFDKGQLFATGQDPLRKDVLEMLHRAFDRESLQLIPAVDFGAPLPALEALRRDGATAEGLEWIGSDGRPLQEALPPRRGLSPHYNTLDPRVQAAMLEVIRELAARYAHHASFGGVAIQLSPRGFAQLPGPQWGLDDATISRFERETRIRVPGTGADRFAARAAFLGGDGKQAWTQWRAASMARFYHQVQTELTALRRGARVYLAGANMLTGDAWDEQLRPSLSRKPTLAEALLRVGFDPQHFTSSKGPVFLRPERCTPTGAAGIWAADLELTQLPDFDRCFQPMELGGSHFFHPPLETRLESFDLKSPFKPTHTLLLTQAAPSDRQNRRRFVRSLAALDSQVMFDGGWLLPLGQEDAIRGLLAAYRRLPPVKMERVVESAAAGTAQPVVFRTATHNGRTYLYAVNDSPVRVSARVRVDAPAGTPLEELSGVRKVSPLTRETDGTAWSVELEPYDLVAIEIAHPQARISQPQVSIPGVVEEQLQQRIRDLGAKAAALRSPPAFKGPDNAGFERPGGDEEPIPDWSITRRAGVTIEAAAEHPHNGSYAARLASDGPIACLVSKPIAPPTTGRLSMSAWLRTPDATRQPSLRLAFEGRLNGQPYYRYAEVGATAGPNGVPLGPQWAQYVFPVDDLPLDGLTQLRVRFDLMGAGEVWIDDMQLFDLAFNQREHRELAKLITVAQYQLQNRQIGDCIRVLEGYWPTFLDRNVADQFETLVAKPIVAKSPADTAEAKPPTTRSGFVDKVRDIIPEKLRF